MCESVSQSVCKSDSQSVRQSLWNDSTGILNIGQPVDYTVSISYRHTVVCLVLIQSGDDDYLMNETIRKPTTGTRCPTLFDKWHGIFHMPSRTDTTGHTKAF